MRVESMARVPTIEFIDRRTKIEKGSESEVATSCCWREGALCSRREEEEEKEALLK